MTTIPDGSLGIHNQSGATLYVYDYDYANSTLVRQTTVGSGQTQPFAMHPNTPEMRIYFSHQPMTFAHAPDPFNPQNNGDIQFSFFEYNYTQNLGTYTADISFVDVFSFPMTIQFDNPENAGRIWGITNIDSVISQLTAQGSFWPDLVWRKDNNFFRIVGPNNAWAAPPAASKLTPQSILNFNTACPKEGTNLYPPTINWTGWQDSTTLPLQTGWVKALHAASLGQQTFNPGTGGVERWGFYLFPKDDQQSVFDDVPQTIHYTLNIFPPTAS